MEIRARNHVRAKRPFPPGIYGMGFPEIFFMLAVSKLNHSRRERHHDKLKFEMTDEEAVELCEWRAVEAYKRHWMEENEKAHGKNRRNKPCSCGSGLKVKACHK